ncbi:MAG TPA: hypothetical protein DCX78_10925, partial [Nitrospina sp.]|nr:hypothetical protein [Nitrospina sp.]
EAPTHNQQDGNRNWKLEGQTSEYKKRNAKFSFFLFHHNIYQFAGNHDDFFNFLVFRLLFYLR